MIFHCMFLVDLVYNFYHLSDFGYALYSDSKHRDIQAGIDTAFQILASLYCGANLIPDSGYLVSGLKSSYERIVIWDEIIGLVRPLAQGIHQAGPGENFIESEHTLNPFREIWYSPADRRAGISGEM